MARAFLPLLLFAAACTSTGSVGESQFFMQDFDEVFVAAEAAVSDVGGRIVTSNRASGTIAGVIESAELGGTIRLHVTVRRPVSYADGARGGADVTAAASMEGAGDDPATNRELRDLEERLIDILNDRLAEFGMRKQRGRAVEPGIPGQSPSDPWGGGGRP